MFRKQNPLQAFDWKRGRDPCGVPGADPSGGRKTSNQSTPKAPWRKNW